MRRKIDEFSDSVAHNGEAVEMAFGKSRNTKFESEIGDHRHEVGVASALAVPINGSLHLGGTTDDRGNRVGNCAA